MKSCIIALFTFSKWSFSGLSVSHYPILSVLFCNKNFESHLTPIKNSWLKQYNWVINFQYVSVPITLRYIRLPTYMWKVWKRVENIQNKRNYNSFFFLSSAHLHENRGRPSKIDIGTSGTWVWNCTAKCWKKAVWIRWQSIGSHSTRNAALRFHEGSCIKVKNY